MSAWVAAPLAVLIVLASAVVLICTFTGGGWLAENTPWLAPERLVELFFNAFVFILLVGIFALSWYGVFLWLMGWA